MIRATAVIIIFSILTALPLAVFAETKTDNKMTGWHLSVNKAKAAMEWQRYEKAASEYTDALHDLEKCKISPDNAEWRNVMLEDIPNLIEKLSLQKSFTTAESLAKEKLNCARIIMGNNSVYELDTLQDLLTIYNGKQESSLMTQTIAQYAGLSNTLHQAGKTQQMDEVVNYRQARLQRKLKEDVERLGRQFTPASKIEIKTKQQ